MNRRQFLLAAAAAPGALAAPVEGLWGGPVIDIHAHTRTDPNGNAAHCDGVGISHAILLTRATQMDAAKAAQAAHPGRFYISASTRLTSTHAADDLTNAVKAGAIAFGELKDPVQADGFELQYFYALAAELDVPILVHFQEYPNSPEGVFFAKGFKNMPKMLEKFPSTKFVAHANSTWGNISGVNDVAGDYPSGKIAPGGLTDKMLADYPNLYADLSANSGQNAMSRDPEFTAGFLERHQDKLLYGSDCPCLDGKGAGITGTRLPGKCLSRETLSILKTQASPIAFRKIVWENTHRVYKIEG